MGNFNIIYKILKILENSMGDEKFSVEAISAKQMKISYERWEQLMIMLADEGYISGVVTTQSLSDKFRHIAHPINPSITIKGLAYLADNNMMARAKEALKMVGEIL